jgi:hypothetical protein
MWLWKVFRQGIEKKLKRRTRHKEEWAKEYPMLFSLHHTFLRVKEAR